MTVPDDATPTPEAGQPGYAGTVVRGVDVAVITCLIVAFLAIGITLLYAGLYLGGRARELNLAVILAANLISVISVLAAAQIVLVWRRSIGWRELGFAPIPARWVAASAGVGTACVVGASLLRVLLFSATEDPGRQLVAPYGFTWLGLIGMVMTAGALMPLVEEFYYRGVLYRWMRSRWRAVIAVPVSAAIFGFTHIHYAPGLMVLVALLGIVLALAYERTGSLWPPIIIHATNNTIAIVLVYIAAA